MIVRAAVVKHSVIASTPESLLQVELRLTEARHTSVGEAPGRSLSNCDQCSRFARILDALSCGAAGLH